MESIGIQQLARRIRERRAGKGVREAAKEVGISPATLSRVENEHVPDLETYRKICLWLEEDPAVFLGIKSEAASATTARVHFKKGSAIKPDSAKALSEMILLAQQAFLEEELES
ncbi:helix-turn-helix domain-containing protein [Nitrogeniibacter aestuarii]|uniref:helix-turn-helix domain-containing protein n=1 Tax=Nitrogeniibacter aestuarii TaxID=2815343 RepID=UPI001D11F725|nr:helix-turn-helix transcriptional regulator [Nitrogeniibacter aestuarii]